MAKPTLGELLELVDRLLERPFDGRDALLSQRRSARAALVGPECSPTVLFDVTAGSELAFVRHRVAVEGVATDVDGMRIHVLLHVIGGKMAELEVFREDGLAIANYPRGQEVVVVDEGAAM